MTDEINRIGGLGPIVVFDVAAREKNLMTYVSVKWLAG